MGEESWAGHDGSIDLGGSWPERLKEGESLGFVAAGYTGGIRASFAIVIIILNKNSLVRHSGVCLSIVPCPSGLLEVTLHLSLFLFCCCHQGGDSLRMFLTSPGDR